VFVVVIFQGVLCKFTTIQQRCCWWVCYCWYWLYVCFV